MSERGRRLNRMIAVHQEFQVARVAADLLAEELRANPSFLNRWELRSRVARDLAENLEATYLIRLFAEFEASLRDAWGRALRQATEPPMRDLLDAIAARCVVPGNWLGAAHRVRRYRNALVHQDAGEAEPVGIGQAREDLARFLSKLPGGGRWPASTP